MYVYVKITPHGRGGTRQVLSVITIDDEGNDNLSYPTIWNQNDFYNELSKYHGIMPVLQSSLKFVDTRHMGGLLAITGVLEKGRK